MSLDINQLVRSVKQAAIEAVKADGPMGVCYGTVTAVSPLEITTDQKLVLSETQLILTNAVRDFTVELTVDHATESISHGHPVVDTYTGGGCSTVFSPRHLGGTKRITGNKCWLCLAWVMSRFTPYGMRASLLLA